MNNINTASVSAMLTGFAAFLAVAVVLMLLLFGRKVRKVQQLGRTDPLTGGLNRAELDRRIDAYLADRGNQYAVVVMELTNYHQLLQTFGDEKARLTLLHLYKVLRNGLSSTEPAARIGGGRFCFLLNNRQADAIRARLNRISEIANAFNRNEPIPYTLRLRYGIYIPAGAGRTMEEIHEIISDTMESSREEHCFYREGSKDSASRNWDNIRKMVSSLANGDFLFYLQPQVRLSDNQIVGAEVLVRWKHPQRGLMTPEMFVPLLEEFHLIYSFDLSLFEQVCKRLALWAKEGKAPCPVALNLSHETVMQKDFPESYLRLAKKYGISQDLIEFELSRSFQQQDMDTIRRVAGAIHEAGFRCALDNFGTDEADLYMLRDSYVDTLKLAPGFFSVENNNRRNRFVVEAIIKIASQLQIRTVAAGIDNASQVQYLKQAGCDVVQGYHYFQPLSVDEFCATAYREGELRHVDEDKNPHSRDTLPAGPNTAGNIVMFSMLPGSDEMVFSSLFSPVLDGQLSVQNATSLLKHSKLIHENDRDDFFRLLNRCTKENGWVENAIRFYTAKGRYEWLEVHLHREDVPYSGEIVISGTLINIAGWKNELDRWKEEANRDALTGLYNRKYFEQAARLSMNKEFLMSAAIVFVDIDDFKTVNDTLGHTVGDDVISWFAKRVLATFRHTDVVARYGGDEFVVFASGVERELLAKRLQQLCEGLRYPYRNGALEYTVSGSIGAAMFPEDGTTYSELLNHADSALYEAKRRGKNQFVLYAPDMAASDRQ